MEKIDELLDVLKQEDTSWIMALDVIELLRAEYTRMQGENAALIAERDTQRELIGKPAEAIYGEYHDMRMEAETARNGWIGAEMRLETALKELAAMKELHTWIPASGDPPSDGRVVSAFFGIDTGEDFWIPSYFEDGKWYNWKDDMPIDMDLICWQNIPELERINENEQS